MAAVKAAEALAARRAAGDTRALTADGRAVQQAQQARQNRQQARQAPAARQPSSRTPASSGSSTSTSSASSGGSSGGFGAGFAQGARQGRALPARSVGGVSVSDASGFLLGLLLWAWVGLPFLQGGPAKVRDVWRAKFLNRGPDGGELP